MTHSLTLEVPDRTYQSLIHEAEAKGRKVEEIALERLELLTSDRKLSIEEFEKLADLLADEVEKRMPEDAKPLSDYAFTRESFYEDYCDSINELPPSLDGGQECQKACGFSQIIEKSFLIALAQNNYAIRKSLDPLCLVD